MYSIKIWLQVPVNFIRRFNQPSSKIGEKSVWQSSETEWTQLLIMSFKGNLSHFIHTQAMYPKLKVGGKLDPRCIPEKCLVRLQWSSDILCTHLNSTHWLKASVFTCQGNNTDRNKNGWRQRKKTREMTSLLCKGDFSSNRLNYI